MHGLFQGWGILLRSVSLGLLATAWLVTPGWAEGDIHEARIWQLRNGRERRLSFANAYGPTAYFYDGRTPVNAEIAHLVESDQAEIVLWSRERDQALLEGRMPLGQFTRHFRKDAQRLVEGRLVEADWSNHREPDFYLIYTSASWCGPCRRFTPRLVRYCQANQPIYGDRFEVVLCSWDQSEKRMIKYMQENQMPWLGNWRHRESAFWTNFQADSIPCLVLVDREGYPLAHSYNEREYLGPDACLDRLEQLLPYASPDPKERCSVPTPGVVQDRLLDEIDYRRREVNATGQDSKPYPLLAPKDLLRSLEEPTAPEVEIRLRVAIDRWGLVRRVQLSQDESPTLERQLRKALFLWHFMPKITVYEGPVEGEFVTRIPLRLKAEFRPVARPSGTP